MRKNLREPLDRPETLPCNSLRAFHNKCRTSRGSVGEAATEQNRARCCTYFAYAFLVEELRPCLNPRSSSESYPYGNDENLATTCADFRPKYAARRASREEGYIFNRRRTPTERGDLASSLSRIVENKILVLYAPISIVNLPFLP